MAGSTPSAQWVPRWSVAGGIRRAWESSTPAAPMRARCWNAWLMPASDGCRARRWQWKLPSQRRSPSSGTTTPACPRVGIMRICAWPEPLATPGFANGEVRCRLCPRCTQGRKRSHQPTASRLQRHRCQHTGTSRLGCATVCHTLTSCVVSGGAGRLGTHLRRCPHRRSPTHSRSHEAALRARPRRLVRPILRFRSSAGSRALTVGLRSRGARCSDRPDKAQRRVSAA